jgi:hypothetical protein
MGHSKKVTGHSKTVMGHSKIYQNNHYYSKIDRPSKLSDFLMNAAIQPVAD